MLLLFGTSFGIVVMQLWCGLFSCACTRVSKSFARILSPNAHPHLSSHIHLSTQSIFSSPDYSCAELLESCQFSEFWPEFRKLGIPEYGARDNETVVSDDRKLLSNAVNGSSASNQIRINMIQMLARTYRSAPLSSVLGALDLKDVESLKGFSSKVMLVAGGGEGEVTGTENEIPIVEKIEGGFVTFASSAENSKRIGSAFKEGVNYDSVAAMMSKTKLRGQ